jgi:glutamate synthase domain-containing protein 2
VYTLSAGDYHYRANPEAEKHMNDPAAIARLQAAVRDNDRELYKQFSALNTNLSRGVHLRGLLRFKTTAQVCLIVTSLRKACHVPYAMWHAMWWLSGFDSCLVWMVGMLIWYIGRAPETPC